MSAFRPKQVGTTSSTFEIGLNKGVLDFSALTTQRTLQFPDANGSPGDALTTDGTGVLSWAAGGGGGGSGVLGPRYESLIATSSQTVFNTAVTTVANSGGHSYLLVTRNGVTLDETFDYTVTGANQITLVLACTTGTKITLRSFEAIASPYYETATATAAQTVFNTTISTVANASSHAAMLITRNGIVLDEGTDYTVTGANQITLTIACLAGNSITFRLWS